MKLSLCITTVSLCFGLFHAQLVSDSTIQQCIAKPGYFFCAPETGSGSCCHASAVDEKCLESGDPTSGTQCTRTVPAGTLNATETAVMMTYEMGMQGQRAAACGVEDLLITVGVEPSKLQASDAGKLPGRTVAQPYEACYWIIKSEDFAFVVDQSRLNLTVNNVTNARLCAFEGSDRANSTNLKESGDNLQAGD